jgi:hypothetical protein
MTEKGELVVNRLSAEAVPDEVQNLTLSVRCSSTPVAP